ncbi:MAG: hypothetical protein V3U49_01340 [Nitrososphaerales archaeon]
MTQYILPTSSYSRIFVSGSIGSGKSAWLEWAAEKYLKQGWLICDLFDAQNCEGAFWSIPGEFGKRYPIVLLHPDYVEIESPTDYVKPFCDRDGIETALRLAKDEGRVLTAATQCYRAGDYYKSVAKWLKGIADYNALELRSDVVLLCREMSNLTFSLLRTNMEQTHTRRAFLDIIRRSRHSRLTLLMDSQRLGDVFQSIRGLCDRLIIKKQHVFNLSEELQWVHQAIEQKRYLLSQVAGSKKAARHFPSIGMLYTHEFYAVWPEDRLWKLSTNQLASFRHKREKDDFWSKSGCSFKVLRPSRSEKQEGTSEVVQEESQTKEQLAERALKLKNEGRKYADIALELGLKSRQHVYYYVRMAQKNVKEQVKST